MFIGKNFERYLTDSCVPDLINKLYKNNKRIFAITSGFYSKTKIDRLREYGIHFEYTIYTNRAPKGELLINFLKKK